MEAHGHSGRLGGRRTGPALNGRSGSLMVALMAAVVAGVLIYMFVSRYHQSTVLPPTQATVFVAKRYIPSGTSEGQLAAQGVLTPKQVPLDQAVAGAISDPSVIAGDVSTTSIAAGQQISATDFAHGASALASQLRGDERAVAIAIDPAHGLTAYLRAGNTVDVAVQQPKTQNAGVLLQDIEVLGNQTGNVVLKLSDKQSLQLAAALAQNMTIWLELRPATGASDSVKLGTVESVK